MALKDITSQWAKISADTALAPQDKLNAIRGLIQETLNEQADVNNPDNGPTDYNNIFQELKAEEAKLQAQVQGKTPPAQTAAQAQIDQNRSVTTTPNDAGLTPAQQAHQQALQDQLDLAKQRAQVAADSASNANTNAQSRIGIADAKQKLADSAEQWKQQIQAAQQQGKDTTLLLNQAKFDLAQQAATINAQIKDQTNAITQRDADLQAGVSQANNANTNATAERGQTLDFMKDFIPAGALNQGSTSNPLPNPIAPARWSAMANYVAQQIAAARQPYTPPPDVPITPVSAYVTPPSLTGAPAGATAPAGGGTTPPPQFTAPAASTQPANYQGGAFR